MELSELCPEFRLRQVMRKSAKKKQKVNQKAESKSLKQNVKSSGTSQKIVSVGIL